MKKNYVKPSLLSETFVTENIMAEDAVNTKISGATAFYLNGVANNYNFTENASHLHIIKFSDFE